MPMKLKRQGSGLYQMTDGDRAIISRAYKERNPNIFLNYYLRGKSTGTWWYPVDDEELDRLTVPEFHAQGQRWQYGHEKLLAAWMDLDKPDFFVETHANTYEAVKEEEFAQIVTPMKNALRKYRTTFQYEYDKPIFHHNHGFIMLDWLAQGYKNKAYLKMIIGGFGSGKTLNSIALTLFWMATKSDFRAFGLGPFAVQANEIFRLAKELTAGTLYEERFIVGTREKEPKTITVGNSMVGRNNTLECYPILQESDKILTLTGDMAIIDQTEKLPDVHEVIRNIGTRFRGRTRDGRERLGWLMFLANSGESQTMWDIYEEGDTNPEETWAYSPASSDNPYLTIADMIRYQKLVGSTEEERQIHLFGVRPQGSGEHFPAESIAKLTSPTLDDMMNDAIQKQRSGYRVVRARKAGIHIWETPPQDGETYAVVTDPGWANPPYRNSPAISAWNITDFPKMPARLVAFNWVFGKNDPMPWLNTFKQYIRKYNAIGRAAMDGTGFQAGYQKLPVGLRELKVRSVIFTAENKYTYLNLTKVLMSEGLLQMGTIPSITGQLTRYELPEPSMLRQDLVMMFLVFAAYIEPIWNSAQRRQDESSEYHEMMGKLAVEDRHWRDDNVREDTESYRTPR